MPQEQYHSPLLASVRQVLPYFIGLYWLLFTLGCYFEVEQVLRLQDVISVVVLLGTAQLLGSAIRQITPKERLAWQLIWVSMYFHIIAEGLWGYQVLVYETEPELPSICDLFYVLDSLLLLGSMFVYLKQVGRQRMQMFSLDFLIIAVIIVGIIYYFQVSPLWSSEYSPLGVMIKIFYPITDLLLTFGLLYLIFLVNHALLNSRDLYLLVGVLFLCLGDELDLASDLYDFDLDWFIEPLWSVPYLFFLLAALQPNPQRGADIGDSRQHEFWQGVIEVIRSSLPFVGTLVILLIGMLKYNLHDLLVWWGMLLVALLSIRQIMVILSNRRLYRELQRTYAQLNQQNERLQQLNEKISLDAKTDFLTGLYNRRQLDEIFSRLLDPKAERQSLSVLLIDVDKFKQVNDTYGHQLGDLTLKAIGLLIRAQLKNEDLAVRYGGDEFMVLLTDCSLEQSCSFAAKLCSQVREHPTLHKYQITLSIGVASAESNAADTSSVSLLRRADTALYRAKEGGRDQYRYFDEP
ncbi:MAG: GGDEF domain-containing protein [Succinivibrio sp.]|nr:GGDEF domain-containing protein [Succinivibrio sp.]